MSNYDKILREKEIEMDLPIDDNTMAQQWASMENQLDNNGIKLPKKRGKLVKMLKIFTVAAIVFIAGFFTKKFMDNKKHSAYKTTVEEKISAIKPPKPAINVPYETFVFNAEKGDTLFTKNGSIIVFPQNAVLHQNGQKVQGEIEVKTREFNDPLEYFMAGIPMQYDSVGVSYNFISSGMIDIKALQKEEILMVNPNAKPQLNLVSTNNATNTNLYQLDTITGKWNFKGKDVINQIVEFNNKMPKDTLKSKKIEAVRKVDKTVDSQMSFEEEIETGLIKPIPPQKASGTNPVIQIEIDPASFKELLVYNNLKFEVIGGDKWNEEDSKIEWQNVRLDRHLKDDNYSVEFSTSQRKVTYDVKPVLENKDYTEALKVYNEKIEEYKNKLQERIKDETTLKYDNLNKEKIIEQRQEKIIAENKRVEALNILIAARNKYVEQQNKIIEIENSKVLNKIEQAQKYQDSLAKVWEKQNRAKQLNQSLMRSFELDGFGYWNCDYPSNPSMYNVKATFVEESNKEINFTQATAVVKNINRITPIYNNNIPILENQSHSIFGFVNDQFYYLTYNDFDKLKLRNTDKAYYFHLRKYNGKANSINDLRLMLNDINIEPSSKKLLK